MNDDTKHPSLFAEQLDVVVAEWTPYVPPELRAAFRRDFGRLGALHDAALKTIEGIWERRERTYAFDESTGLATRRPFRDHLATTLSRAQQTPGSTVIGVLFIDVNNLKGINDTCGHQVGDRALAAVGVWLLRRPPRDTRAAALVVTIGLTTAIMLVPSTRFGYLLYPAAFAAQRPPNFQGR